MNILDIGIIAITAFFVGRGIFRGFFREAGSIGGLILGILAGSTYYNIIAGYIVSYVDIPWRDALSFICFALIFIVVMTACVLIGRGLQWFAKAVLFGWVDRGLGAILALVKAVLICYLIILMITFFLPAQQPIIVKSKLAPAMISLYQAGGIPSDTYEKWKHKFFDIVSKTVKGSAEEKEDKRGENESASTPKP